LLDVTAGPAPGDPYWPPPQSRPFIDEINADVEPLRIGFSARTADGTKGHVDCVTALNQTVALCESLGHEIVEADLPGLTPEIGAAIGTVYYAATAWIVEYWIRRLGRRPEPNELEPLTRAFWESGEQVSAAAYLTAIEDLQRFSRVVAAFLSGIDLWLTPTMSEPPAPLGEITSTPDEPLQALERGARTVGYAGVVANITGNPAMSVPLWWNATGLPIGVHFLGRFGDEATLFRLAAQLETACPWKMRTPSLSSDSEDT
jgi:amidase